MAGAKTQLSVVALCILIPALGIAASFAENSSKDSDTKGGSVRPLNFVYLGTVDKKSYFADYNVTGNWTMAKSYCEAANLQLPSIDTENEAEFLNRTLRQYPTSPTSYYWTSLHESRLPTMMVWDGTSNPPNTTFLPRWYWNSIPVHQYCTLLAIHANYYFMEPYWCHYGGRILCQTYLE